MYQLQHTVGRLYTDYLIYKGFGTTRKYKKALKDNLDQLYIQALGQVVLAHYRKCIHLLLEDSHTYRALCDYAHCMMHLEHKDYLCKEGYILL
jgi:hypothetical protein